MLRIDMSRDAFFASRCRRHLRYAAAARGGMVAADAATAYAMMKPPKMPAFFFRALAPGRL